MIKGISWRVLASVDTFLVTLLVTWVVIGEPSLSIGFTIVFFEFFIKLLIYYLHERAWQFAWRDGEVNKKETIYKSITWRVVATLTTFLIALFALKDTGETAHSQVAGAIAIVELVTKFVLYYLHERFWIRIPLGTVRGMIKK